MGLKLLIEKSPCILRGTCTLVIFVKLSFPTFLPCCTVVRTPVPERPSIKWALKFLHHVLIFYPTNTRTTGAHVAATDVFPFLFPRTHMTWGAALLSISFFFFSWSVFATAFARLFLWQQIQCIFAIKTAWGLVMYLCYDLNVPKATKALSNVGICEPCHE